MTVSFKYQHLFYAMPPHQADSIIYNEMVPRCEENGIYISQYGNHSGENSLLSVEDYYKMKSEHKLFNITKIQKIFEELPYTVKMGSQFRITSYDLSQHLTSKLQSSTEIADGDLIAAMLLQGYTARFGKKGQENTVYCEFKATLSRR